MSDAKSKALEALEALEKWASYNEEINDDFDRGYQAARQMASILAWDLRAALEQKAEPVGWTSEYSLNHSRGAEGSMYLDVVTVAFDDYTIPLYTAPPSTAEPVVADAFADDGGVHLSQYTAPPRTAEVEARALEGAADDMAAGKYAERYRPAIGLLRARAKRIRESSHD